METAVGDGEELGEGGEDDGVGAADAEACDGAAEDEGGEGGGRGGEEGEEGVDGHGRGERGAATDAVAEDAPQDGADERAGEDGGGEETLVRVGQVELRARGGEDQRHGEHLHRVRRVGEHAQRRESILEGTDADEVEGALGGERLAKVRRDATSDDVVLVVLVHQLDVSKHGSEPRAGRGARASDEAFPVVRRGAEYSLRASCSNFANK